MWDLPTAARKILVMSLRRSLLKESGFLSFTTTVPFSCACVAPFPVRGFWEFLHFLCLFLILFLILYYFYFSIHSTHISITTGPLSKQRNDQFLQNIKQLTKNGSFMTKFNAKSSGSTRVNQGSLSPNRSYMEGKLCCVYGEITAVLFSLSF